MPDHSFYRHLDFLRLSVKNLRTIGSISRSSPSLCRQIAKSAQVQNAKVVVEMGAGDGAVTHHLLECLPPDALLLVFEVNEDFVAMLRATFQDPRLHIIHDSALHAPKYLQSLRVGPVDCLVSSIPFAVLPDATAQAILETYQKVLRPGGLFVQYHYTPWMWPVYKRLFGNVKLNFVALNLPPAVVMQCVQPVE